MGIVPEVAEAATVSAPGQEPGVVLEARAVAADAPSSGSGQSEVPRRPQRLVLHGPGLTLRGWIDWLLGGVGNRRSRAEELESGGELDTWPVADDGSGDLVLRSQMRMPRMARLGLRATVREWFHPYSVGRVPPERADLGVLVGCVSAPSLSVPGDAQAIVNWAARRQEELSHATLERTATYRRREEVFGSSRTRGTSRRSHRSRWE